MKKIISIFIGIFLTAGAFAQSSDMATGTAKSSIIVPFSVVKIRDLSLGTFTVPSVTSTFRVANADNVTPSVISGVLPTFLTFPTRGQFQPVGQPGTLYRLEYSAVSPISLADGSDTLGFVPYIAGSGVASTHTYINPYGFGGSYAGGDVTVRADQKPGTYTGTYMITVSYR